MKERLYYLGKCRPTELKQSFDKVYDYYKSSAVDRGFIENEISFIEDGTWVRFYVKVIMEI